MNVLFVPSWYAADPHSVGGIVFREQAKALERSGIGIKILHLNYSWKNFHTSKLNSWTDCGVTSIIHKRFCFPRSTMFFNQLIQLYFSSFKKYIESHGRPDVIHVHGFLAASFLEKVKEHYQIPILLTEHSSVLLKPYINQRHTSLLQKSYLNASELIAVSQGLKDKMAGFTNKPVRVIPNLIDTSFFNPPDQIHTMSKKAFISIGDPIHTKGLDILIKSLAIVRDKIGAVFHLSLGDKIPNRNKLIQLIRNKGLEKEVTFLGVLTRKEVAAALCKSNLYISASRYETFGMCMLEALACGVPVIATRTAGAIDIISKNVGLLVDKEDVQGLAKAIIRFLTQADLFIPSHCRTYAVEKYDSKIITPKIMDVYNRLAH